VFADVIISGVRENTSLTPMDQAKTKVSVMWALNA
jgi:hypothetical protein